MTNNRSSVKHARRSSRSRRPGLRMTCAVSCCVCIASIVMTAPARSVNAFSSSRTAGISFDFSSTATWPRTAPMPCARAATRCGAFPVLFLRAADGLAVDSDDQPAAGLHGPGPEPGTEDPVEHVGADQGERAAEGGLLRRSAHRAQHRQRLRAGIGGPLPDRGERPRPRDHRRDPHGQQPGQRMPAPAPLPRVRDLGKEIEKVVAAGSRDRRRWHRRAGPSRQATLA